MMDNKMTIQQLEAQAAVFARQHFGEETLNVYGIGSTAMTPERAYAQALEAQPELYAQYRAAHNAGALVATLRKAGFQVSQR